MTRLNAERIFMGWDPVPLAPEGRRQIEQLAERLKRENVSRILASDIRRTVESAEIIAAALGMSFETHPALREVNVGEAKGMAYAEAAERWRGLLEREGSTRFPGGESFADVADRAALYLRNEVVRDTGERVLIVTHGGVVIGAAARLLGRRLAEMEGFAVENASLTVVRVGSDGAELLVWNDISHLPPREAAAATAESEAQAPDHGGGSNFGRTGG